MILILILSQLFAARIKDITSIKGVRDNQLYGYGLIVGLAGSGDKDLDITNHSLQMVLRAMNVDVKSDKFESKNIAAVMVSATVRPFAGVGSRFDVTVSSIGSAGSLSGGTLLMTPLQGADGKVYAMAEGQIPAEATQGRSSANATSKILAGGILEKNIEFDFSKLKSLILQLNSFDFTTAARIAEKINQELGAKYAAAIDGGRVELIVPTHLDGTTVDLMARIENLSVDMDLKAKVVLNRKTGTVVLGENVRLSPVAIAHNNLRIEIKKPGVSTQNAEDQKMGSLMTLSGPSVSDIVVGLNETGATAQEIIAIFEALKSSGALVAELDIQ